MMIRTALFEAIRKLKRVRINSAPLDAEILLSFVLKTSKEFILANPNDDITIRQSNNFRRLINRRKNNEPIAYIVGEKEFYGLKFKVSRDVLIPRPETELIVDLVLPHLTSPSLKEGEVGGGGKILIDVGTGSGCIPISIAKNLKKYRMRSHSINNTKIFAIDISKNVLKIARQNAKLNGVYKKITFLHGDLLKPFEKYLFDFVSHRETKSNKPNKLIITANLPYVPTSDWKKLPPNIKNYEPQQALDGGKDGLKYYRKLFKQLARFKNPPCPAESGAQSPFNKGGSKGDLSVQSAGRSPFVISLFVEIAPNQKSKLRKLILKYFPPPPSPSPSKRGRDGVGVKFHKDLAGRWRAAEIQI